MKKIGFTAYLWSTFVGFYLFILYFSNLEFIQDEYNYSALLEQITYFLAFGISAILFFRAFVYTLRFSVDRLSRSRSKKEEEEDSEFRLIIETLLIFLTIAICTSLVLINHMVLENTPGRNSDVYAILINILGASAFVFMSFIWPLIGEFEEIIAKKLFR